MSIAYLTNSSPANASPHGGRSLYVRLSPRARRRLLPRPASVLVGVFLIMSLAGCVGTMEGPPPAQIIEQTELALEQAKVQLETMPADDPGRQKVEQWIATTSAKLEDFKLKVKEAEERGLDPDTATYTAAGQTVAGFLPPPFNAIATIAGGLLIPTIAGWFRERRKRQEVEASAAEVLKAVQTVAVANGGVLDFGDELHRTQLKAEMNDKGMSLVAKVGATVPRTAKPKTRRKAKPKAEAKS